MWESFPGREQPAHWEGPAGGSPGWHLLTLTHDWERGQGFRACSSHTLPLWWELEPAPLSPCSLLSPHQPAKDPRLRQQLSYLSRAQRTVAQGLEGRGFEFTSCTHAALGEEREAQMRGSRSAKPRAWLCLPKAREAGLWLLPLGSSRACIHTPIQPSPLHSPRWDVWNLPPGAGRRGPCCSPRSGQGVGA